MKHFKQQTGAAAVELGLMIFFLLLLVMGMIDFGFIWLHNHYIANAAREGARVAAVGGDSDAVKEAAENHLRGFYDKLDDKFVGKHVTIVVIDPADPIVDPNPDVGDLATVEVTVTADVKEYPFPFFLERWQNEGIIVETAVFPKRDQSN